MVRVLGIETSCDETAAAVVDAEVQGPGLVPKMAVVANVVHSQEATHARFGGVVPEVASREHISKIVGIVRRALGVGIDLPLFEALQGVDAIAVTLGPGLIGPLLVGAHFAKGAALAANVPLIGVNHLEGHLSAAFLDPSAPRGPHVALVVSGGHTHLYHACGPCEFRPLGATRDDAAGEAFDKIAKFVGLGYPGGAKLEAAAQGGDPTRFKLPRARLKDSLDFSFSGLKTAAVMAYKDLLQGALCRDAAGVDPQVRRDFCASVQEAIADALAQTTVAAAKKVGAQAIILAGGVAANGCVRQRVAALADRAGCVAYAPPKALCTDNAAMIAACGIVRFLAGERADWASPVRSRWSLGQPARAA